MTRNPITNQTFAAILFTALVLLAGCKTVSYSVTRPDGTTERFDYLNAGFDVKAGKLDVQKDGQKVGVAIENLDSQSQALQVAGKALDALRAVKP